VLIDRPAIARLIPHAGEMCLLDGVLSWDATRIRCTTESHRSLHNPLRHGERLGMLCGVEYAAQAMALHGALAETEGAEPDTRAPRVGFLAGLRGLACHGDRLDLVAGPIIVEAERLFGEDSRLLYAFTLRSADRVLLAGRAAVVLGAIVA
jgi:predicted hotdog family 3-hydroxylacyl-ACP dehydratase